MSTMKKQTLPLLTLASLVSSVYCQGEAEARAGILLILLYVFAPIIIIALISWCLAKMMRSRRSVGVIRVIPATTTMIQVPQPIVQPAPQAHPNFSFGINTQPSQPEFQVRLPQEQQQNQLVTDQQKVWQPAGQPMSASSSGQQFQSSSTGVNQGYQPEPPPAYEYELEEKVPKY